MDGIHLYLFYLLYFGCVFHYTFAASYTNINKVVGKDKYLSGDIITSIHPIGFQQCQKTCSKRTKCLSTNYNKDQLTCELISTPTNHAKFEYRTGFIHTVKVCLYIHFS